MSDLNISNFIWNIADDVLRDVYVRGKYRDVILPMTVIRRLDAVLEPTKDAVLAMKAQLDKAGVANQHAALCQASSEAFYNTSQFRLRDLTSRARRQQLKSDFEAYLDGFSPNVQEVLDKFKFRNQIPTLVEADALGFLIEKFLDPSVNLSPKPVLHQDGCVRLPGLDNHSMGTIFEELIRRFNEENNEEAGEHFTPRDVVELMAYLIFMPIADEIQSGTYLVYDGACGTGGMLTVAEETLVKLADDHGKEVSVHLYGQEVNPETFAISKADLILKGEGAEAENMKYGSTLSSDAFPSQEFDFMLSNPPYGKSWKSDLDRLGGKKDIADPRFVIEHGGNPEYSLITRSSDGQMVFLANMLNKMKKATKVGSRIAEVHNGSSLFTGDAGSGESNVRRWVIENDWLEAIIALPLNIFYNTGIATYIWVLSNRKAESRKGKVQLIDATAWFKPLRKNLGKKNCVLGPDDIRRICNSFLNSKESEQSKIFPNAAFGYWKVTVERPLRLKVELSASAQRRFAKACAEAAENPLIGVVEAVAERLGEGPHLDFNRFLEEAEAVAGKRGVRMTAKRQKLLMAGPGIKDAGAEPVIKKVSKIKAGADAGTDALHGNHHRTVGGKPAIIEYEPDTELRDTEQVPFLEDGGIEAFFRREVLPHAADAPGDRSRHPCARAGNRRPARRRSDGRSLSMATQRYSVTPHPVEAICASDGASRSVGIEATPARPVAPPPPRDLPQPSLFDQPMIARGQMDVQTDSAAEANSDMSPKPYSGYRDSGLPWLGEIPEHWDVRRNGRLFAERVETGFEELPILEVSLHTGVRVRDMENGARKQQMADRSKYKRAVKGDIAYNMMRMWQGAVGVAPANGLISPAYVVARPFAEVDPRYYTYLFRTPAYMREVNKFSRGIVSDRNRLYWDEFKQMPSAFPSTEEQTRIADFLDAHGRLTARLIRNKRRLIGLLNEQKQAIINQAVTRGLNPAAPMKPTGIDWMPEIPAHWEVIPLRHLSTCLDGKRVPLEASARGRMLGDIPYWGANQIIDHLNDFLFDEDLILLGEDGAPFFDRTKPVAFFSQGKVWPNNHIHVLRPKPGNRPEFIVQALNCVNYTNYVGGATRDKLTQSYMKAISIPIPPKSEQDAIIEYLERECAPLDETAKRAAREVGFIQEYRERLIADVVTGKLDVRHVEIAAPADEPISDEVGAPDEDMEAED